MADSMAGWMVDRLAEAMVVLRVGLWGSQLAGRTVDYSAGDSARLMAAKTVALTAVGTAGDLERSRADQMAANLVDTSAATMADCSAGHSAALRVNSMAVPKAD